MSGWLDRLARASADGRDEVTRRDLVGRGLDATGARAPGLERMARRLAEDTPLSRRRALQVGAAAVAALSSSSIAGRGRALAGTDMSCNYYGVSVDPFQCGSPDPVKCGPTGAPDSHRPGQPCCSGGSICCSDGDPDLVYEGYYCCPPQRPICSAGCCGCTPERACGSDCCQPDEVCSQGRCLPRCPSGQTRCGDRCCDADQRCVDGRCLECSAKRKCGKVCCEDGWRCTDPKRGRCCPPGHAPCDKRCCEPGYVCIPVVKEVTTRSGRTREVTVGGRCVCPQTELCGGRCCGADDTCMTVDGREFCCPAERYCADRYTPGPKCCPPDSRCVGGECHPCEKGRKACGDTCCATGARCVRVGAHFSYCECPGEATSCQGKCCKPNERCIPGQGCVRCPRGATPCDELCCSGGTVCTDIGPAPASCDCPRGTEACSTGCCEVPGEELWHAKPDPKEIARDGRVPVTIECRGAGACRGTITVVTAAGSGLGLRAAAAGGHVIARGTFRVPGRRTRTIRVKMSRRAVRELKILGATPVVVELAGRTPKGRRRKSRSQPFRLYSP